MPSKKKNGKCSAPAKSNVKKPEISNIKNDQKKEDQKKDDKKKTEGKKDDKKKFTSQKKQ